MRGGASIPQEAIKTEADALADILAWSQNRPVWQRDTLRRLVVNGELADSDIEELTALCKDQGLPAEPIAAGHLTAQQAGAPTVALMKIANAQNVNALAESQSLGFLQKGVTIIYGDNGAGKSGYVRILKKACRARTAKGKDEKILGNVYEDPTGPQSAEIAYHAGAQTQTAAWKSGEKSDDLLTEISVFDARTANVHVEETNDLAYTPYPMKLLERLVNACKAVKEKFDSKIAEFEGKTPQSILHPTCSAETLVGKLVTGLSKDTSTDKVKELATLSDEEVAQLAKLTSDFASDPTVTARRIRSHKKRLENLQSGLTALSNAVSAESAGTLKARSDDLAAKAEAARLSSENLFRNDPLPGVGSATWQRLWEAARAYSTQEAYQEVAFPVTAEDALCVLCHQELGQDASVRLTRFETFIQDTTKQEEGEARQALEETRAALKRATISLSDMLREKSFIADDIGEPALVKTIREFAVRALWRLRAMLRTNEDVAIPVPALDTTELTVTIDALEDRASALLANDENNERKALRARLAELKDRQWLSGIKDDVLAQINRLSEIAVLKEACKNTRPNEITAKNTQLSSALITERLRARFAKEIDHLDLAGLAVELTQAGSQYGVSRFKIGLIQSAAQNAGEIFSEGEYRCVALAGFLAELATNDSASGIIFDDPVSSLDHLHREAIANRLAAEARERQVIVFTHDLPFLFMLRRACTTVDDPALKTEIALRHIQKRQNKPGHCRNQGPDKTQDAKTRLQALRAHLTNTRFQHANDPDSTDWLINARGMIDSLRQTWEAAVEDAISPVLRTFSSKVDTKGFAKLSAITENDAKRMRARYGKCSELLHKASDELNPTAPSPAVIEEELDALSTWLDDVTDRQKSIAAI